MLSNDRIKIVDFGLGNIFKNNELLRTPCGSPCYAAPEMLNGELYSPNAVDMWSSGVILFALICGYLPFEDENTSDLYRRIIDADYKIPNFISSEACELIKKILVPDPEKRLKLKEIINH